MNQKQPQQVAVVQMPAHPFAWQANLQEAAWGIAQACDRAERPQWVFLPELFNTGTIYHPRLTELAEPVGGTTTQWMLDQSLQYNIMLGGGIIEQAGPHFYDTFVLTTPQGFVFSYRKQYPAHFENLYFRRGQQDGVFHTPWGRLGVLICWDMGFRKLARALQGRVDMVVVCAAWPDTSKGILPTFGLGKQMRRLFRRSPRWWAQQLQVPVVLANRSGVFSTPIPPIGVWYECPYWGQSRIYDAQGHLLTQAGSGRQQIAAGLDLPVPRPDQVAPPAINYPPTLHVPAKAA